MDLVQSNTGLAKNGNNEVYAIANQWSDGLDGKRYLLKPDAQGRLIKRISANFRYPGNSAALSNFMFYDFTGVGAFAMGILDDRNNQLNFRIADNTHLHTDVNTAPWNGVLEKTFATPIPVDKLYIHIGGRSGYTFTPIYMGDLTIEWDRA